jgi:C-terminal processing protease CtpA/Prc
MLSGVTPYDIGFEYGLSRWPEGSNNVVGQIFYVKPNTDAMNIGLKRGEYFSKINGIKLNTTNYSDLLSGDETSLTISFSDSKDGATTDKTVKRIANYAENPVFLHKVFNESGHKIGYLVYNFFASGSSDKDNSYDKQLNDVFGYFKNENITELVLDLRYNSGGSMNSATLLASMIVPDLNTKNVFTRLKFNSLYEDYIVSNHGEEELIDRFRNKLGTKEKINNEAINNVGKSIQKLYVLIGKWTASASELVINGLEPYMKNKIVLVGNITVGKNVGSITIYEDDKPNNKWGMQPIVLTFLIKMGKPILQAVLNPI